MPSDNQVNTKPKVSTESAADQVHSFASDATIHGVNRIAKRESGWPRRLLWLVLWLVMATTVLRFVIAGTMRYLSYPFNVHVTYENIREHPFPDVTICNNNYMRKSLVQEDPMAGEFFQHFDLTQIAKIQEMPDIVEWLQHASFASFFERGTIPTEEFISDCGMGVYPVPCPTVSKVITGRGMCYTMTGFVGRNGDGEPLVIRFPGITYGYRFYVDVHSYEYSTLTASDGVGVIAIVHPTGEPPNINNAFGIAPGTEQHVALKVTHTSRLGEPYGEPCQPEKGYSLEKCGEQCLSDHILENCGCDFWGRIPSVRDCSIAEFTSCWEPAYEATNDIKNRNCSCPLPCEETTFNLQLSSLKYPSDAAVEKITARTGRSKEYLEKNMIEMNIYFQDFIAQKVREKPAYELMEFAADAGGQMGLFLGASLISLSELFEFVIDLFLVKLKQRMMVGGGTRKEVAPK